MKRLFFTLALILALTLSMASAEESTAAEPAPYVPGSVGDALFAEAFDSGKLVLADLSLDLDLDAEVLGIDGDDLELLNAVLEAVRNSTITLGAAKLEDGLLLTLGGQYAAGDAEPVSANVYLGVTRDGLWLETDQLPGERITAPWEPVLSSLGLDDKTIQTIMTVRDVGLEAVLEQLTEQLQSALEEAAAIAQPYMTILSEHAATLPLETKKNVAEAGILPAARHVTSVTVTEKALGALITDLVNQLETDKTLAPLLDAIAAEQYTESGEPMTAAGLCQLLRDEAAAMTDEQNPAVVSVGFDEDDNPMYLSAGIRDEQGASVALNLVFFAGEKPSDFILRGELLATDKTGSTAGFTGDLTYITHPANELVYSMTMDLSVLADDDAILSMHFTGDNSAVTAADSLPRYATTASITFAIDDGVDKIIVDSFTTGENGLTADGGEYANAEGTTDMYVNGEQLQTFVTAQSSYTPGEDGPVGQFIETVCQPDAGINAYTIAATLYTAAYTPAENPVTLALDSASAEEVDALTARLMDNCSATLDAIYELLPDALTGAEEEDDVINSIEKPTPAEEIVPAEKILPAEEVVPVA